MNRTSAEVEAWAARLKQQRDAVALLRFLRLMVRRGRNSASRWRYAIAWLTAWGRFTARTVTKSSGDVCVILGKKEALLDTNAVPLHMRQHDPRQQTDKIQ